MDSTFRDYLYELAKQCIPERDFTNYAYLLGEAANKGNSKAIYDIGYSCYWRFQDYSKNLAGYMEDMNTNSFSSYALGYMYDCGYGVPQNKELAMKYYLKAANMGNRYANEKMGVIYETREGIENYKKAMEYYTTAANNGSMYAVIKGAKLFETNLKDHKVECPFITYLDALKIFTEEQQKNNGDAMYWLGFMYQTQHGVHRDINKGNELIVQAAFLGNVSAIGYAHSCGLFVWENEEEKIKWYEKFVENGVIGCAAELISLYCSLKDGQEKIDKLLYLIKIDPFYTTCFNAKYIFKMEMQGEDMVD